MSETDEAAKNVPSPERDCETPAVDLSDVLKNEYKIIDEIRKVRAKRKHPIKTTGGPEQTESARTDTPPPPGVEPGWKDAISQAHDANYTGLCFSGGGIRSATFNLGVLQALAELKLLHRLDYLSTVSGGGYIGAWLAAWILRRRSFFDVQERLGHSRVFQDENKEPTQIRFLRMFSNYLTPKLGAFSADTWAMVSIYTRNMLLNLVVLLALLAAALLVPHIVLSSTESWVPNLFCQYGWAAVTALLVIHLVAMHTIRNAAFVDGDWIKNGLWLTGPKQSFLFVGIPLMALAFIGALWAWRGCDNFPRLLWTFLGVGAFAIAWMIWMGVIRVVGGLFGEHDSKAKPKRGDPEWARKWWRAFGWGTAGACIAGGLTGLAYSYTAEWMHTWTGACVFAFGVPLLVLLLLCCSTVHIGVMGIAYREAKREWWARAVGLTTLAALIWMIVFAMALLFPRFVSQSGIQHIWKGVLSWKVLTPAWIVSTVSGVFAGKSTADGTPGSQGWRDILAKVAPYVFVAGLLCWISWSISLILYSGATKFDFSFIAYQNYDVLLCRAVALCVICVIVGVFLSWRVDINQFSMHMFYRNRLVRCYLGASNRPRHPNLFTGFCEGDDVALHEFLPHLHTKAKEAAPLDEDVTDDHLGYDGPYPVFNMSLNLVKGQDLAWQERKAESFVMTPQYCGYDVWLEEQDSRILVQQRDPDPHDKDRVPPPTDLDRYGYRPTESYAFPPPLAGPRLGLAMAISGAAVSPSMGYYSTAPVGFLMTVFDVRLGQWLGNPRDKNNWTKPTPKLGLMYLLNELFGGTDDNSAFVYLSDGGHFENMGLYEMVKRRCGLVIVCDAEADGDYEFAGIGNAIRKCRIDLGVDIQLDISAIVPNKKTKLSKAHCAVGTIHYENADPNASPGTIIYVKASLAGDEPTDVKNYSKTCPAFPHESTVDQWFTETQFESYRALGYHIISSSFRNPLPGVAPPSPAPSAPATAKPAVDASGVAAPAAPSAKFEVKVGEQTVPVQVNITLPMPPAPSPAVTPSPVPTMPGPGSIPANPKGWSKAAENAATQPLYERVQSALEKSGFDMSSLNAPDADADKPKAKAGV